MYRRTLQVSVHIVAQSKTRVKQHIMYILNQNNIILYIQYKIRRQRNQSQIANILWIIEKARDFHKNISVQFSPSVVSYSLRPQGLQHARPPCPSPTPGVHSNSCPSSRWCHPIISSFVFPFSSCLQSFPVLGSFPMRWFFTSGGQSIGVSASASVLPMNIQDWFPLGLTGWISLQSKGLSRVLSNTTVQKHQFFHHSAFFTVQLSCPHLTIGKTIALTRWTFVGKVTFLLFNILSRLVIAFLPRSKRLLISWLQSPSVLILELPPTKISHCFHCFSKYLS